MRELSDRGLDWLDVDSIEVARWQQALTKRVVWPFERLIDRACNIVLRASARSPCVSEA
jgi:hypothetical protein